MCVYIYEKLQTCLRVAFLLSYRKNISKHSGECFCNGHLNFISFFFCSWCVCYIYFTECFCALPFILLYYLIYLFFFSICVYVWEQAVPKHNEQIFTQKYGYVGRWIGLWWGGWILFKYKYFLYLPSIIHLLNFFTALTLLFFFLGFETIFFWYSFTSFTHIYGVLLCS